jgi:hypothetical protein
MLYFFEVPREDLKIPDKYISRFFWEGEGHKKKYRLTKWSNVCMPKDLGGLGILDLEIQNKCLLSNLLFCLINEYGEWQNIIIKKYLRNKIITQVEHMPGDTQFWFGLLTVKVYFLRLCHFKIRNGTQIRFWEDKWLDNFSFKERYLDFYNIV